jgi:hypothetical protein
MCQKKELKNLKSSIDKTTVCNEFNTIFWDCFRHNNYSIKTCSKSYYNLTKCINSVKTD